MNPSNEKTLSCKDCMNMHEFGLFSSYTYKVYLWQNFQFHYNFKTTLTWGSSMNRNFLICRSPVWRNHAKVSWFCMIFAYFKFSKKKFVKRFLPSWCPFMSILQKYYLVPSDFEVMDPTKNTCHSKIAWNHEFVFFCLLYQVYSTTDFRTT